MQSLDCKNSNIKLVYHYDVKKKQKKTVQ